MQIHIREVRKVKRPYGSVREYSPSQTFSQNETLKLLSENLFKSKFDNLILVSIKTYDWYVQVKSEGPFIFF